MRQLFFICAIAIALCGTPLCADKQRSAAELRALADGATGEQCVRICMDAARAVLEESNNFYTAGDVDKGLASMKDAAHYAQKATEQSIHSRKKQKQTEIGLRKLSKRIIDVKDTLNFEDKPPVLEIVYSVDKLRVRMLAAMFDLDPPKDEK